MKRATLMLAVVMLWAISSNAFAGPVGSTLTGKVFNDLNGDGSLGSGEPGLAGWTVNLINPGGTTAASTTTDSSGNYSFTGVLTGTFFVAEVLQSGYTQTAPAPPGTYTIMNVSGVNVPNLNFGDFQSVTVSGEVYNDLNDNGNLNSGEPGLSGWTVKLLNSSNTVIASTLTNSSGTYSFSGVGPGKYTLEEVPQSGWNLTQPTPTDAYSFTTTSGTNQVGLNFGNFQAPVVVPEPASLTLLSLGSLGLLGYGWRRRNRAAA
jgi:hypothetical protein